MSKRHIVWLTLFAIAMAQVEASLVVHLRTIYYPSNPQALFPLSILSHRDLGIEFIRELATVVMIGCVALLAASGFTRVFAAFINTDNYLVVTSAAFAPTTALGTFTDFISASNFFVVGPAPNANLVWAQSFDTATQTGIGSFAIDVGAVAGSVASGQIVLTYDLFTRSPLDALFNPVTDTLSNGNLLTADASVAVVPLPGAWLFGSALVSMVGFARRRQEGG